VFLGASEDIANLLSSSQLILFKVRATGDDQIADA